MLHTTGWRKNSRMAEFSRHFVRRELSDRHADPAGFGGGFDAAQAAHLPGLTGAELAQLKVFERQQKRGALLQADKCLRAMEQQRVRHLHFEYQSFDAFARPQAGIPASNRWRKSLGAARSPVPVRAVSTTAPGVSHLENQAFVQFQRTKSSSQLAAVRQH